MLDDLEGRMDALRLAFDVESAAQDCDVAELLEDLRLLLAPQFEAKDLWLRLQVAAETPAIGTAATTGIDGVSLGGRAALFAALSRLDALSGAGLVRAGPAGPGAPRRRGGRGGSHTGP